MNVMKIFLQLIMRQVYFLKRWENKIFVFSSLF